MTPMRSHNTLRLRWLAAKLRRRVRGEAPPRPTLDTQRDEDLEILRTLDSQSPKPLRAAATLLALIPNAARPWVGVVSLIVVAITALLWAGKISLNF